MIDAIDGNSVTIEEIEILVINLSLRNVLILLMLVLIPRVIYSLITAKNPKTIYGRLMNGALKQIVGV
jgi:hypothetical protein